MKPAFPVPTSTAISIAALLWAGATQAAPSDGETLFREGRAAMQEKNYEVACAKFAESQKKEPAPGTALNLGECEEQRGHLVAAGEAFALAAATFTSPEKQRYAASRAEAADRRTPRLTVRASAIEQGLVVHVGAAVIPVDSEVKMDPGEVTILAEAPGRRPKELKATLREGKSLEVDIGALEPEASEAAPAAPVVTVGPSKTSGLQQNLRPIGLIVGGVGAASLVVGAVTGVLALDRASTVEERCTPDLVCDREGLDAARSGSTLSLVSTITIAVGSTALVGGAVLYFLAPRAAKTTGGLRMTPSASRDGAGISIRGVF